MFEQRLDMCVQRRGRSNRFSLPSPPKYRKMFFVTSPLVGTNSVKVCCFFKLLPGSYLRSKLIERQSKSTGRFRRFANTGIHLLLKNITSITAVRRLRFEQFKNCGMLTFSPDPGTDYITFSLCMSAAPMEKKGYNGQFLRTNGKRQRLYVTKHVNRQT